MDDAAFLRLIAAAPDDDAPRLVCADWLEERGDPRGTFIRAQCALARLPADHPRRHDLEHVERGLLAAHGAAWAAPVAAVVRGYQFRRGFVDEVTLTAEAFLEHAPAILRPVPVRTVRLRDSLGFIVRLARSPHLARVRVLDLCANGLTPGAVAALAKSAHVRGLTGLVLNVNDLADDGVRALAAAGRWPRLEALHLRGNRVTTRGAVALARSPAFPQLAALDLGGNRLDAAAVRALAHSRPLARLADLGLFGNPLGDAGARALAAAPLLPRQLARTGALNLNETDLGPAGLQALLAGGRLASARELDLGYNRIGDEGVTALSVTALPHLTELRLPGNALTDEAAAALAGSPLLKQLTLLDLSWNAMSEAAKVILMSSPYWHWRLFIDTANNHPPEPEPESDEDDDAPIPLVGEED